MSTSPTEAEEMEIGYDEFRNKTMAAPPSDEVQCLSERLKDLSTEGYTQPNITQPMSAAPIQEVFCRQESRKSSHLHRIHRSSGSGWNKVNSHI